MQHCIFCLTKEEAKLSKNCGWNFITEHMDRIVPFQDEFQENAVDPGYMKDTQRIVYQDKVYMFYKDYMDLATGKRIFMLKPCLDGCELLPGVSWDENQE